MSEVVLCRPMGGYGWLSHIYFEPNSLPFPSRTHHDSVTNPAMGLTGTGRIHKILNNIIPSIENLLMRIFGLGLWGGKKEHMLVRLNSEQYTSGLIWESRSPIQP
jgi:hypothetical protein